MNIKIYTTPTCHFCHQAKEFFKEHNIKFQEIDVENNEVAQKEMIKKSGAMATPVIDINGSIIIGFDEDKLREKLNIKE